jgi:iron complex outermembrane receptor protein
MSGSNTAKLCAVLCVSASVAAMAQESETGAAPTPEAAAAPAPEPAPAAAAAAAADDDGVSEVIVTARRIEERLQDVPISMTVFNQEQLTSRNVISSSDLATFTPSLSANTRYGSDNALFAIRGFSQEIRTTASVGTYFADVVAPRGGGSTQSGDGAGPGMFFDLQNVQVLKGPQGTLFGRNTTGGAVLLVPTKPTFENEGYAEQSWGNYDMRRTQVVFNTPIADWARFRIGVDRQTREGYLKNISGIGPDNFNDIGYTAIRASLVLDLSENVENYTIASKVESDTNGPLPRIFAVNPNHPLSGLFGGNATAQIARNTDNDYYAVENSDPKAHVSLGMWQVINTTTWNATDDLTVKNIASYAELTNVLRSELFGSNFYLPVGNPAGAPLTTTTSRPSPGMTASDQSTLTEELQFQGRALDNKLNWQSGAYFERSKPVAKSGSLSPTTISCEDSDAFKCYDIIGAVSGREGQVGTLNNPTGGIEFRNLGLYAQGDYSLTEQLRATAGLRYTKDKTEADTRYLVYYFPSRNTPSARCATATQTPVTDVSVCDRHFETDSDAVTWVLGLDYKLNENAMTYGKYSRGYRQGSISPYSVPGLEIFDPEQVDTYELGLKTSFNSVISGTFNVAAFYNDFKDQQLLFGVRSTDGSLAPTATPINAGKSRIYGLEIESSLRLLKGLTLDLNYAYLNTKLQEADIPTVAPPLAVSPTFEVGRELPFSPENKGTATLTYKLPLPSSVGGVFASATYAYTDKQLQTVAGPYGVIPSYELVNANIAWSSIYGGPVDVSVFATNLLDKEYYTTITGSYDSFAFEGLHPAEPRMVGARIRVRFGGAR